MSLLFFMAYERDDDDNDNTCAIYSMGSERIYAFLSDTDGPEGPVLTSSQGFGSYSRGCEQPEPQLSGAIKLYYDPRKVFNSLAEHPCVNSFAKFSDLHATQLPAPDTSRPNSLTWRERSGTMR